ncbi:alpha/beta fold hydrolase [Paracoccus shanxieyensis]|uniref:Alpha/beta fold hydrolase n=1 Tax=Paracoccus shanxieyensis TaxID=2675752 RepID=A0A6L6IXN9_9RHOB|nr:alpha/beta hydrolase [Paracoccus shanxieyensis]MTH64983.1 alpha/beta fold hydrolase [Paracoccus shanxieyensis]MTH88113.1 alpha/beta fold hydrolase [Paracoccus shanxieyensis]
MDVRHFTAGDGARLAYREQGQGLPVLALSGLTRTGRDFEYLAPHLDGVRLICPDYRGRGDSQWTGPASYTVQQEAQDAIDLLDLLEIEQAAVLGTSRGGIIGMYLAATSRHRLHGLCLNDVGPVLHKPGLARIIDYVGRNPVASSHADLARKLPLVMPEFRNVPRDRWLAEAQLHYAQTEAGLKITYDPQLREGFVAAFEGPEINLWPLFDAAHDLPLALIRGGNSDLLSPDVAAQMRSRRPDMIYAEVPDRGHIPFLDEPEALAAIEQWLALIPRA